ncbi:MULTISPECIES: hypothetical protein [Enterococcus]|uniref:Uncharacterized protein n=2 Tax=Enterococcus entomosocium TaxID=3034352 RepID=A0ABV3M9A8_9ENTE|nr:hypothetical protein [Enterococcus casseliflavus]MDB1710323.1 hypothetical protein [Enterococcus casseliflavus]MDB1717761.1 hypothetical protein [Enterococcus casseliflavus]
MGKPLIKTLTVLAVGIGAVAICFIGYRQNNQRQYQQRVEYAQTAIASEKDRINELANEIAEFYSNEDQTFLRKDLKEEDVLKTVAKLSAVKVSADDYGIDDDALPSESVEIQQEKTALDDQLKDIEAKLKVQADTEALFTESVSNWQSAENDVIIRADLKETDVGNVRENLSFFEDSKWKELVVSYLEYADTQLDRIAKLQETFDEMLDGDEVTSEVTLEKYLSAVDSISKVRNEELKEKFTELADKVATQMGYTGYSTYTPPASTESYSEDTSAGDGTWTDQSSDTVY